MVRPKDGKFCFFLTFPKVLFERPGCIEVYIAGSTIWSACVDSYQE